MSENNSITEIISKESDLVSIIYKKALRITNERLDQLNSISFAKLREYRERYPEEYKRARDIFKNALRKVLNGIQTEIINKIQSDVMGAFNDNF